ncbi:hypothetical protein [uncultured Senegalimassilia sp.]|uniref:hypothetical protein n=1 Tax=uncultured Senegalimassilia sp. TaxID=1714350 RepID=UPI0027DE0796|nr:hypothetical protein [uncultured Senegalimassilia sp.]
MPNFSAPTAWVETYESNGLVTDWYIHTIGDMLADMGLSVRYADDCTQVGSFKQDLYFVSEAKSAAILVAKGCRHLIYWAQGIAPEEDYLRFGSKPRRFALAVCEKTALRRAARVFMVSGAMQRHFESKYKFELAPKTFLAPCCNEALHPESFATPGKYEHPVFTYAGGLSKYQCIDGMLDLFARIQGQIPAAELLFYTWDTDKACELVTRHGLSNVTVESKKQEELPEALERAKYGFVIRDDIAVNCVATPTKISTYMSNGVIPVVSSCVEGFAEASRGLEHVVCCPEPDMVGAICDMERRDIDASEILGEYRGFFDEYFDLAKKQDAMRDFLAPVACDMGLK